MRKNSETKSDMGAELADPSNRSRYEARVRPEMMRETVIEQ